MQGRTSTNFPEDQNMESEGARSANSIRSQSKDGSNEQNPILAAVTKNNPNILQNYTQLVNRLKLTQQSNSKEKQMLHNTIDVPNIGKIHAELQRNEQI